MCSADQASACRRVRSASEIAEGLTLPVVQTEDIVGLKIQAAVNDEQRAASDWADIRLLIELSAHNGTPSDWALITDYLDIFGLGLELKRMRDWYGKTPPPPRRVSAPDRERLVPPAGGAQPPVGLSRPPRRVIAIACGPREASEWLKGTKPVRFGAVPIGSCNSPRQPKTAGVESKATPMNRRSLFSVQGPLRRAVPLSL